jgi:hypothetical protein
MYSHTSYKQTNKQTNKQTKAIGEFGKTDPWILKVAPDVQKEQASLNITSIDLF